MLLFLFAAGGIAAPCCILFSRKTTAVVKGKNDPARQLPEVMVIGQPRDMYLTGLVWCRTKSAIALHADGEYTTGRHQDDAHRNILHGYA